MSNLVTFFVGGSRLSTRIAIPPTGMRKAPRQARSRATVDAVLEAAARILSDHGWAGFTTNTVAAAAGVSIGSYYQYFPDKHALVAAIRGRHLEDCLAAVRRALDGAKPLDDFASDLVDGLIAVHREHPGLHRVLLDEVPSPEAFRDPDSAFERAYLGLFTAAARTFPNGSSATPETVGTLLSDALDGVIHNAARRGRLGDGAVRDAAVRLVIRYLGGQ